METQTPRHRDGARHARAVFTGHRKSRIEVAPLSARRCVVLAVAGRPPRTPVVTRFGEEWLVRGATSRLSETTRRTVARVVTRSRPRTRIIREKADQAEMSRRTRERSPSREVRRLTRRRRECAHALRGASTVPQRTPPTADRPPRGGVGSAAGQPGARGLVRRPPGKLRREVDPGNRHTGTYGASEARRFIAHLKNKSPSPTWPDLGHHQVGAEQPHVRRNAPSGVAMHEHAVAVRVGRGTTLRGSGVAVRRCTERGKLAAGTRIRFRESDKGGVARAVVGSMRAMSIHNSVWLPSASAEWSPALADHVTAAGVQRWLPDEPRLCQQPSRVDRAARHVR